MEGFNVYKDIQDRTGGEIYIGVVGPVRTGKSTFIKKFMDTVVIPHIPDGMQRERAIDELPQSLSLIHISAAAFCFPAGRTGRHSYRPSDFGL